MQKNKKITSIKVVHANGREPGLTQYKGGNKLSGQCLVGPLYFSLHL